MSLNIGTTYNAIVKSITDADTLILEFPSTQEYNCCLFGIDAPESSYALDTWPDAYDDLPPNLQEQEFGFEATDRFKALLISNTGNPDPIGLTLTVIVRGIDKDDTVLVTIENNEGDDVCSKMLYTGHAIVWDKYAQTIPELYSVFKTNENNAKTNNLIMWSNPEVYYPQDYRNDVDDAARHILYNVIEETMPENQGIDFYIDDNLYVIFSREIEVSYISSDYFKLYKTNSDMSMFESAISTTISKDNTKIIIDPDVNLVPTSYYVVILVGENSGITAVDGKKLEKNYTIFFKTNISARPDVPVETQISSVDLWVDADHTDDQQPPSTNLFSSYETSDIVLLSTIPTNHSVGVHDIKRVQFRYNDDIANSVPEGALRGQWSSLPIDEDPFGDRNINISGIVVNNNLLIGNFEPITQDDSLNKEYTFTLSSNVVQGVNKTNWDSNTHIIKFIGKLSPLYATPDQIKRRLEAWENNMSSNILDYDLYKLIHEKSLWTDNELKSTPVGTSELIQRNNLVICLILYEIIAFGYSLGGDIKSRTLLQTQVEFYRTDYSSVIDELQKCIKSGLSPSGSNVSVYTGIKSGSHIISRHGKKYEVYR